VLKLTQGGFLLSPIYHNAPRRFTLPMFEDQMQGHL
jgi:hypothetical protein